jgi:hypothetical protein
MHACARGRTSWAGLGSGHGGAFARALCVRGGEGEGAGRGSTRMIGDWRGGGGFGSGAGRAKAHVLARKSARERVQRMLPVHPCACGSLIVAWL